jgi:lactoylglutathione lyase
MASDNTTWTGRISAISLFAEDLAATRQFYLDVFGLPILFEDADSAVFNFGNTLINLLKATAATELIEPAAVAGPGLGARAQLTIDVDDVDATCAELARRGVVLINGPMDRPWGVRTACFADPAGHVWEIAK